MKVTVSNKTGRPLNISKLAPLMPTQVLSVNEEIEVNVKDIEKVLEKAAEIGVTVTPMDKSLETVVDESHIADTIVNLDNETDTIIEGDDLIITNANNDDLSDFIVEEIVETEPETIVEEKPKKKRTSKKSAEKKSALNKIIGNNKN